MRESPSPGFAVPSPFRQGRLWGREMRIATASVRTGLAMTGVFSWGAVDARAGGVEPRPYEVTRGAVRRGDVGIAPYGGVIDGAVCGGTHGSRPTLHYFVGQGPCALPWVRGKPVGPM